MKFTSLITLATTATTLLSGAAARPPPCNDMHCGKKGTGEPWGWHAHIHLTALVSDKPYCVTEKNQDPMYGFYEGFKRYDIKPGQHKCHKMNHVEGKSYVFRASARVHKAKKKSCRIIFYRDEECQDEMTRSVAADENEKDHYSDCEEFEERPGSLYGHCDF